MRWLQSKADGVVLAVRVIPRSAHNEIQGEHGDALKIRLQAPPVEGRANDALVEFVAERLKISRAAVSVVAGETSRNKRLLVTGLDPATIAARLRP